jgi:hypothetical protein
VFYTYAHYTPEGRLFYIGKGNGYRAYSKHRKNQHWKNIVAKYGQPKVEILANWDTEEEALSHEVLLIECFRDMGYKLCNKTNGGEGTVGYKHTPEQIKAWSDMRLGDKNPNYGGKAWTEETFKKLRQPKKNKENYKGSPGKICVINKLGEAIQITTEIYNKQKDSGLPMEQWEFVSTVSKIAKNRRQE